MNFFCQHKLTIARRHASTVTKEMEPKALYVDIHDVWNFIVCKKCKKMFDAKLTEPIFEQKPR